MTGERERKGSAGTVSIHQLHQLIWKAASPDGSDDAAFHAARALTPALSARCCCLEVHALTWVMLVKTGLEKQKTPALPLKVGVIVELVASVRDMHPGDHPPVCCGALLRHQGALFVPVLETTGHTSAQTSQNATL